MTRWPAIDRPFGRFEARGGSPERSWRVHLGVLLGLAIGLVCSCGGPAFVPPERVLLLSIDTLRADHVGCYGASNAHTPNLDAIAAQGVRFEVALSPVPLTLPAHASLLTGLEPPAHGVRHNSIHRLGAELPTLAERMRDAGYATAAFVGAVVLDRRFGLDRGFDVYDDHTSGRVSASTGYGERTADEVVEATLAWLEAAPDRFFLWVHFYDPHMGYEPPAGFASAFASDPYAGEIAFVDAEIGRLLRAIRARWGEQKLLVVATSDHGESLGEHGEATHSYTIYEATQRIPLLLSGPGLRAGGVAPGPASLLDVAPAILSWVGAQPLPEAAGRDLRELLGRDELDRRSLYMETVATQLDFGWSALLGVRSGRFKYIRAPRPELYDLALDPGEIRNRVGEEPALAAELDALLERHLAGPRRTAPAVELPEEDRAHLRSLGYLVPEGTEDVVTLGRVGGTDPKDAMGVLRELTLAQADLLQGRPEQAVARLRALDDTANTVAAHLAAARLAAGDPAGAAHTARAVLIQEPGRTDMRILLARALAEQGRKDEADLALAGLAPDTAPAPWVALGAARGELASGRSTAALHRLALARARHPNDLSLAQAHGNLLEAAGRLEEALTAREAALALAPDQPGAANDVAWTLALLGQELERALALARSAVAEAGDDPALLDTLASVLLLRGDTRGALDAVERALPGAQGETRVHLLRLRAEASEDSSERQRAAE
jgi:arylsulfatase A-like enzyme/Flp pilus assembly protein TadD